MLNRRFQESYPEGRLQPALRTTNPLSPWSPGEERGPPSPEPKDVH